MKNIVLLLYLTMSFACSNAQVVVDSTKFAIFKTKMPTKWKYEKNFRIVELTEADFAQIEHILSKCIDTYNLAQKQFYDSVVAMHNARSYILEESMYIDLKKYRRQVVAVIGPNGEKQVWVNCFRISNNSDFDYWRQTIVRVRDGGNSFFNVIINLTKKACFDFIINGDA